MIQGHHVPNYWRIKKFIVKLLSISICVFFHRKLHVMMYIRWEHLFYDMSSIF